MASPPSQPPSAYSEQQRGEREAYARYLAGMDASMRQKVALTAAHLLCEGRVADMGMGSGTGSEALAALYPGLDVVGVDVNETMVELARERYGLPNLSFIVGDIAKPVFEAGSLDGIFDSSVLHHVTTFSGYDHAAALRALEAQVGQLKDDGVLIVRDFVDPGRGEVLLDLPLDDGDDSDDVGSCSSARLFERFAREFRSLAKRRGFEFEVIERARKDADHRRWRRYRVSHKHAVEFVLRKDYRADWEAEVKEEYTYFTQAEFEAHFRRLGLRVVASTPIRNPWIVRNRFRGQFRMARLDGTLVEEMPATNYVIVGEKVPAGRGVQFREAGEAERSKFLQLVCYEHRGTGRVMDLVRRPHTTIDMLPWFDAGGDVFVLARKAYPRPILSCDGRGSAPLDGRRLAGYVSEPLYVFQEDKPIGLTVEEALGELGHIGAESIKSFRPGGVYYPSPGGIQEEVRSILVEIEPRFVERELPEGSGFSSSGQVRAIEAWQLLRAAQVGGLPDARLELNVYDLLRKLGRSPGPWIGEAIALEAGEPVAASSVEGLLRRPPRRMYRGVEVGRSKGFLEIARRSFEELDATGRVVARRALEFVVPRPFSFNTVSTAPLRLVDGEALIGIDDYDLPAAQCFNGNSNLLVAPAWRIPRGVATIEAARAWIAGRMAEEYGLRTGEVFELGGPYCPSAAVTPEIVFPIAVEVLAEAAAQKKLAWVRLRDLVAHLPHIHDGHLRIVTLRAAHALGLLGEADERREAGDDALRGAALESD